MQRVLDGTLYDDLSQPFSVEQLGGTYLPLLKRRPSTPYNLARIVVDQTSGLLWGGEQMPLIECGAPVEGEAETAKREKDRGNAAAIVTNCSLDAVMLEVHEMAAPGSAAIIVKVSEDLSPHFEIVAGKYVMPVYDPMLPGKLVALVHVYPTSAKSLRTAGIEINAEIADSTVYWCRTDYTAEAEQRYTPLSSIDYKRLGQTDDATGKVIAWHEDAAQRYEHNFGVVPAVWAKCLIGGDAIDGRCLYGDIVDIQVEITYLLSQIGRGLRFSADPLLARKRGELASGDISKIDPLGDADEVSYEIKGANGETIRSANNVLDLGANGDAKFLEISGEGLKAAGEHIKILREWALEVVGAMKSDSSTTKGVQSGKALEMLYQALQLLLKRMRIALGNRALVPLVRLLLLGAQRGAIVIDDLVDPDPKVRLSLKWPQWSTPRGAELLAFAQAIETLAGGSQKAPVVIIPADRLSPVVASELGFDDPATIGQEAAAERARIEALPDPKNDPAPFNEDA